MIGGAKTPLRYSGVQIRAPSAATGRVRQLLVLRIGLGRSTSQAINRSVPSSSCPIPCHSGHVRVLPFHFQYEPPRSRTR